MQVTTTTKRYFNVSSVQRLFQYRQKSGNLSVEIKSCDFVVVVPLVWTRGQVFTAELKGHEWYIHNFRHRAQVRIVHYKPTFDKIESKSGRLKCFFGFECSRNGRRKGK